MVPIVSTPTLFCLRYGAWRRGSFVVALKQLGMLLLFLTSCMDVKCRSMCRCEPRTMLMTYVFDASIDALCAIPCRLEIVTIWHTMVLRVFGRCHYLCVLVTWLLFDSHLRDPPRYFQGMLRPRGFVSQRQLFPLLHFEVSGMKCSCEALGWQWV